MFEFRLKFHRSLPLRELVISQHWFGKWLGAEQVASHYLSHYRGLGLAHSHTVRCGFILLIFLPVFRANLSYLHKWREGRQKIKQAHHTSVPSDCGLAVSFVITYQWRSMKQWLLTRSLVWMWWLELMISLQGLGQFMMTSSNGNIFRVTDHLCGEFPVQRPVTRSFDVFFDLLLNKQLSEQSRGWWFEMPSRSLWRQRDAERKVFETSVGFVTRLYFASTTKLLPTARVPSRFLGNQAGWTDGASENMQGL